MKVSIVIPTYNASKTILHALESALQQDFPKNDFEVIVVNDGSTDGTLNILKKYKNKINIIHQKNKGAVKAANVGFKKSKGKYIIKLDADDYFSRNIVKKMADILDKNRNIDFVYCDYYERDIYWKVKVISVKNNLLKTVAIGIMFRRDKFKEEGFYDENLGFPEYDLLLKTQNKWSGFYIAEPLFSYLRRKESVTGNKVWLKNALAELKRKYPKKIGNIRKY